MKSLTLAQMDAVLRLADRYPEYISEDPTLAAAVDKIRLNLNARSDYEHQRVRDRIHSGGYALYQGVWAYVIAVLNDTVLLSNWRGLKTTSALITDIKGFKEKL